MFPVLFCKIRLPVPVIDLQAVRERPELLRGGFDFRKRHISIGCGAQPAVLAAVGTAVHVKADCDFLEFHCYTPYARLRRTYQSEYLTILDNKILLLDFIVYPFSNSIV